MMFSSAARTPYPLNVDFANLRGLVWPKSENEQAALIQEIPPSSWRVGFYVNDFLSECRFRQIAALSLATDFGQRWFDVWQHPQDGGLVAIKEPAWADVLVIGCSLHAGSQGPTATFALLSGRVLACETFPKLSPSRPLLVKTLVEIAEEEARSNELMESELQDVCLRIDGFTERLPDGLLLCSDSNVTPADLQEWLSYLQTLSFHELTQWDFSKMPRPRRGEEVLDTDTDSDGS